jgi:hypothetical protein
MLQIVINRTDFVPIYLLFKDVFVYIKRRNKMLIESGRNPVGNNSRKIWAGDDNSEQLCVLGYSVGWSRA